MKIIIKRIFKVEKVILSFQNRAEKDLSENKNLKQNRKKRKTLSKMLKIQMLEQIVTNDNVADEQQNDPDKSPQRTPVNLSPQRNGLVNNDILILFLLVLILLYLISYFNMTKFKRIKLLF